MSGSKLLASHPASIETFHSNHKCETCWKRKCLESSQQETFWDEQMDISHRIRENIDVLDLDSSSWDHE